MKILYVTDQYKPEYYTGTIKITENLIKFFSKYNEVELVSYSNYIPLKFNEKDEIVYWNEIIDGIKSTKLNVKNSEEQSYSLFNNELYSFAKSFIEDYNPDIIHICHPRKMGDFIKAAIELKKKYIITLTDSFMICPNLFLFTKNYEICNGKHKNDICHRECNFNSKTIEENKIIAVEYMNNAYALVTPSNFQRKIYEEYFDNKIITINHGNNSKKKCNKSIVYPKKKLIFGFTSNSSTLKGLNVAIQAFNNLYEDIDVELHVYGSCDDVVILISNNNIKFFGEYLNSDISEILSTIDILICPSIGYESYSFVLIEALSNNVPVISSNEGGMKELVKNCINGFTFEVGDFEHLTEIIKYVYHNQEIIEQFKKNLLKYSCQTVEQEMNKYEEIYQNCIRNEKLEVNHIKIIDKLWENVIKSKYKFIDTKKYMNCIEKIARENNYSINNDCKYRFIIRMKNMEEMLKNKKRKNVFLWGTGMSAVLTLQIIKELYEDINVNLIVDKFKKDGEFNGISIENVSVLEYKEFDHLLICTSPGKKDAELMMNKLNKKANIDYNFGICIE